MNTLTLREIEALPSDGEGVTCYKGVGRMSVSPQSKEARGDRLMRLYRFVQEPRPAIEANLRHKTKEYNNEVVALEKKIKVSTARREPVHCHGQ